MPETTDLQHNRTTLIRAHFDRIRRRLEAEGAAAKSFHHGLNRGQIREAFIREFLKDNTSEMCGIGTGEIISSTTPTDAPRNQIDIVLHNNRYPKVSISAGIDLFFGDTVSSFIEIKSHLEKRHIRSAARSTKKIKSEVIMSPQRFNPTGMINAPRPYSFVFAYDGPKRIGTVMSWMKEISSEDDYNLKELQSTNPAQRHYYNNLFIDGVFVLGKGCVLVDALPFQSPLHNAIKQGHNVSLDHIWLQCKDELPLLWVLINCLSEQLMWSSFEMSDYLGSVLWSISD